MKWDDGHAKLFLSHLAKHKVLAQEVSDALKPYGVQGFVAHTSIRTSKRWRSEIVEAVKSCDAIALFIHNGFYDSEWCDQETGIAVASETLMIPLRFESKLPKNRHLPRGWASEFQAVDCRTLDHFGIAREILVALLDDVRLGDTIRHATVARLGGSHSFREAQRHMDAIEAIVDDDDWNQVLVNALEASLDNRQVGDAFGVQARIEQIIDLWYGRLADSGNTLTVSKNYKQTITERAGVADNVQSVLRKDGLDSDGDQPKDS